MQSWQKKPGVRVSLWDEKAEGHLNEGCCEDLKMQNTTGKFNVELNVWLNIRIFETSPEETERAFS